MRQIQFSLGIMLWTPLGRSLWRFSRPICVSCI